MEGRRMIEGQGGHLRPQQTSSVMAAPRNIFGNSAANSRLTPQVVVRLNGVSSIARLSSNMSSERTLWPGRLIQQESAEGEIRETLPAD